ncbi:hypothetical protein IFM89_002571 [Coptis chinensis]|uniref:Uncharacterized protein n=1 Tax=Coptis chinensis TaxID=261450 RepID=A0A835LLK0_9MAGN|nr:hypothetical protein IFM89_002571 [Coptis chinensis]
METLQGGLKKGPICLFCLDGRSFMEGFVKPHNEPMQNGSVENLLPRIQKDSGSSISGTSAPRAYGL